MRITTLFKRGWLRRQAQLATDAGITLLSQLSAQLATVDDIASGQVIASTSANGHSTAFSTPGSGAPRPDRIVELADEMLTLHATAEAALAARGIATPTDAQRLDQMLALLTPATSATTTYVNLRGEAA